MSGRRDLLPGAALLLALAVLATGCDHSEAPAHTAPPTPIARLNTGSLAIPRIDFCGLVSTIAVDAALSARRWKASAYGNGDTSAVAGGSPDVMAEHGCGWRSANSSQARAWVFSRPVSPGFAGYVVGKERHQPDCHVVPGPRFGTPTVTQHCVVGGRNRIRHAGLFGDSWLSCEVTASATVAVVRKRTDAWCVEVANALNTTR